VSEPDRRARGIAAYASQFGVPEAEAEATLAGMVGSRMAEEAIQAAGAAWAEESPLSLRERSLVVVAALAAQGGADARLRGHLRWAIEHGVSAEELEAALTLLAVYAGFPRASVAMELLREEITSPARERSSRSRS
jgi:4-carboxymuconolactone decarboxylase